MLTNSLTFPSQSSISFPRHTCSIRATISKANKHSEATVNKSLYEVLRVKRNASQTEIKTAYRTLAKLYHPDATARFMESSIAKEEEQGGDEDQEFIHIHNAYATLSDPDARAAYDANLSFNPRKAWTNSAVSGFRRSDGGGFYSTWRWETDQCW